MRDLELKQKQLKIVLERLGDLTEAGWDDLIPLLRPKVYKKDDVFLAQGEMASDVAFIIKGGVQMFYTLEDGRQSVKAFNFENSFFAGYSSLLTGQENGHTIEVLEETEVFLVNYKKLLSLYDKHMYWQKLGRLIAEQEFLEKEKRELEFLLYSAEERFESFKKDYPFWETRIPKNLVASYLGVNPSTLSRIIKKQSK